MKSWRLFWICTVLVGHNAICSPYVSIFDGYGKVTVSESSSGLKTEMNLQVDPKQKYMIKYLSSCRATSPYLTQFRHSFEIITTSDKQGKIQQSSYFLGMRMVDLNTRSLDTVALYLQERSHWKMLTCVVFSDSKSDLFDNNKQQP